jgi:hypothetical protein
VQLNDSASVKLEMSSFVRNTFFTDGQGAPIDLRHPAKPMRAAYRMVPKARTFCSLFMAFTD